MRKFGHQLTIVTLAVLPVPRRHRGGPRARRRRLAVCRLILLSAPAGR